MLSSSFRVNYSLFYAVVAGVALVGQSVVRTWAADTNAPTPASVSATSASALTGEQALQRLMDGNARYVAGQSLHPDQSTDRRTALAGGQAPFAIVLTCSDS